MSTEKKAFTTPELVHIANLAHARAQELQSLLQELGHRHDKHRTALQILPRYMRRRAASYNIKRLPKSLRPFADPKTGSAKTKCPSRRFRRRPRDLLSTYTNRQRKVRWLKTHIWHAKRFHMSTLWNYRLAQRSNTKSIRPTYKSLRERCIIHDMSYVGCIELEGKEQHIIDKLEVLFSAKQTNLTPKAKLYLSGQFEGQCLIFKPNTNECVTPIHFMWMPKTVDGHRKLWLWCHPASYNTLVDIIRQVLESSNISSVDEPPNKKQKNDSEDLLITMKLLRDEQQLARFRLVGPLSMAILRHALRASHLPKTTYERKTAPSSWWTEQIHSREIYEQQLRFWNNTSPKVSTIMPNRIVSIVIRDPRLFKPIKPKLNIYSENNDSQKKETFPPSSFDLATSPLWNEQCRNHCSEHKLATYQINLLRSKSSDSELNIGEDESHIPLILVHHHDLLSPFKSNASYLKNDFGSGWDIILPNEWAQIIWISLVYSGARPIGQDELNLISHETGELQYPHEYPDTESGLLWEKTQENERLTRFSRCPPSKRPNFLINGIQSPFRPLWANIVRDWAVICESNISLPNPYKFNVFRDRRLPNIEILHENLNCLLPIRVECKGRRGVIDDTTLIFMPTVDDLKSKNKSTVESRHADRARIEERKFKKNKEPFHKGQAMVKIIEHRSKDDETPIIDSCDRKLLGAVTSGAFQFSRACCTGKGFIASGALLKLLEQQQQSRKTHQRKCRVLIRMATSRHYRWASIQF